MCCLAFLAIGFRSDRARQLVKDGLLHPILERWKGQQEGGQVRKEGLILLFWLWWIFIIFFYYYLVAQMGLTDDGESVFLAEEAKGGSRRSEAADWKFKDFDAEKWNGSSQCLELRDGPADRYFRTLPSSGARCFVEGTDFVASADEGKCACAEGYFGRDCGIPESVWRSHFSRHPRARKALRARASPRRLVHGVLVNHEFDFFEARVRELEGVVDAYIVQESNFTTFGTAKELLFLKV